MKYRALRGFIRYKRIHEPYTLNNRVIVVDGRSFFNKCTYEESGCQYIYGAECDRYASYLKMKLNWLKECGVTAYFVFNGGMKADLEYRTEKHNYLIQNRCQIDPGNVKDNFFDPIFAKDVHLEVLNELGIMYSFSMYDSRESIISLAKKLSVPVVTDRIEYCFYGVSCIPVDSIEFESERKTMTCRIYLDKVFASNIGLRLVHTPLLLALSDEDSVYFEYLPRAILGRSRNVVASLMYWLRWKNKDDAKRSVLSYIRSVSDREMFLDLYNENENILQGGDRKVVRYFEGKEPDNFMNEDDWFINGVANGKIALPYINLKKLSIFSGSWLIPDIEKDDALLAALDITGFALCLLKSCPNSTFTFIGRKGNECSVWEVERNWDTSILNDLTFKYVKTSRNQVYEGNFDLSNPFFLFLHKHLKGFDYELLVNLRPDSWVLIITLVYYIKRCNKEFVKASYCIILSYVMLGYVSEFVGVIKRSNFNVSHNVPESISDNNGLVYEDCTAAANTLMDLFYIKDLESGFNCTILHNFAEFQHCLHHMNFLNKLCGEAVKCTMYNKTFNGTFVYNLYIIIKDKENPLEHLKTILGQSTVNLLFFDIIDVFNKCLASVESDQ